MKPVSSFLLAALAAFALAGCSTQEALTAKATDCSRLDLKILPSKYREQGSTTTWCAQCRGETYRCLGNADRTRVECRPIPVGDVC
jgi:hypothetical protein